MVHVHHFLTHFGPFYCQKTFLFQTPRNIKENAYFIDHKTAFRAIKTSENLPKMSTNDETKN